MSDQSSSRDNDIKSAIPKRFKSSSAYWDERYCLGGNSGAGSRGILADYKAQFVNDFVERHSVKSVIEFGFGDGEQLSLAKYRSYLGVDVSVKALEICQERFIDDETKRFLTTDKYQGQQAELSMSLDVIYHLVEDDVYEAYMRDLFLAAQRFVVIYSSDWDEVISAPHVRHRCFTDWIKANRPDVKLKLSAKNPYQFDPEQMQTTTFSDFQVFEFQS